MDAVRGLTASTLRPALLLAADDTDDAPTELALDAARARAASDLPPSPLIAAAEVAGLRRTGLPPLSATVDIFFLPLFGDVLGVPPPSLALGALLSPPPPPLTPLLKLLLLPARTEFPACVEFSRTNEQPSMSPIMKSEADMLALLPPSPPPPAMNENPWPPKLPSAPRIASGAIRPPFSCSILMRSFCCLLILSEDSREIRRDSTSRSRAPESSL